METSASRNYTIVIGMVHKSEKSDMHYIVLIKLTYDCTGWTPTLLNNNQVICAKDSFTVDTNCYNTLIY